MIWMKCSNFHSINTVFQLRSKPGNSSGWNIPVYLTSRVHDPQAGEGEHRSLRVETVLTKQNQRLEIFVASLPLKSCTRTHWAWCTNEKWLDKGTKDELISSDNFVVFPFRSHCVGFLISENPLPSLHKWKTINFNSERVWIKTQPVALCCWMKRMEPKTKKKVLYGCLSGFSSANLD